LPIIFSSIKVGSFICPPLICTHSCLVRHISSPLFFGGLPVKFLPRFLCVLARLMSSAFFWGPLVCHISSTKVGSFICSPLIARIHVSYVIFSSDLFLGGLLSVIFHPQKFVHSSVRRSSALLARICVYAFVCVSRVALTAIAGVVGVSVCFLQVLLPRRSC
jgi:hypothetical protein